MAAEFVEQRIPPVAHMPAHGVPLLVRRLAVPFGIIFLIHSLILGEGPADGIAAMLMRHDAVRPPVAVRNAPAAVPLVVDDQKGRDILVRQLAGEDLRAVRPDVFLNFGRIGPHVTVGALPPAGTEVRIPRRDDRSVSVGNRRPGLVGHHPVQIDGEVIPVGLERLHAEHIVDAALGQHFELGLLPGRESLRQDADDVFPGAPGLVHVFDGFRQNLLPAVPETDGPEIRDPGTPECQGLGRVLQDLFPVGAGEDQVKSVQAGRYHRHQVILSFLKRTFQGDAGRTGDRGIVPVLGKVDVRLPVLEIDRGVPGHRRPGLESHGLQRAHTGAFQTETHE